MCVRMTTTKNMEISQHIVKLYDSDRNKCTCSLYQIIVKATGSLESFSFPRIEETVKLHFILVTTVCTVKAYLSPLHTSNASVYLFENKQGIIDIVTGMWHLAQYLSTVKLHST